MSLRQVALLAEPVGQNPSNGLGSARSIKLILAIGIQRLLQVRIEPQSNRAAYPCLRAPTRFSVISN